MHAHHADTGRSNVWKEATHAVHFRGKKYTVSYPKLNDPRIVQIAVLTTVSVLGQLVFHFHISIWQIILVILTSTILDTLLIYRSAKVIAFPTSGFISSLSLCLLMEVSDGPYMYIAYVAAGVLAILSKHFLVRNGRHIFNPSNFSVVILFLILGHQMHINPDEWTASIWLLIPIVFLGVRLILKAKVAAVALWFLATEALFYALYYYADGIYLMERVSRSYISPITPALLIFTFFMITDPRTVPRSRPAKIFFGSTIASLHWLFLSFGLGSLSLFLSLFVVCFFVPVINHILPD